MDSLLHNQLLLAEFDDVLDALSESDARKLAYDNFFARAAATALKLSTTKRVSPL